MRRLAIIAVTLGASLAVAAPAFSFAITNPSTGVCSVVMLPGASFPGNWDVVSGNAADYPGPWNGVFQSNDSSAITGVRCPA